MKRRILSVILIVILCIIPAGCRKRKYDYSASNLSEGARLMSAETKKADDEFCSAYSRYTVKMLKNCITEGKNSMISPLSIMMALAMTANGADGETLSQLEELFGLTIDELNRYLYAYILKTEEGDNTLAIADSIWIRHNFVAIREEFLSTNKTYYHADVFEGAFDEGTVKNINNWVSEKTNGMIDKLLEFLSADDFMVLVNAICFEGKWEAPYEEYQVRKHDFTCYNKETSDIDCMFSQESGYLCGEGYEGFIKPYKNYEYSFVAVLPDEDTDIYEFIDAMPEDFFDNITDGKEPVSVDAMIPKFKSEYGIMLKEILMEMGVTDAFGGGADFSKMCEEDDGVCIDEVIHKTFIEVDENGTRAAAATGVIMKGESCEVTQTKSVYLDRPFVYAIIDNETGIPVFVGNCIEIK